MAFNHIPNAHEHFPQSSVFGTEMVISAGQNETASFQVSRWIVKRCELFAGDQESINSLS